MLRSGFDSDFTKGSFFRRRRKGMQFYSGSPEGVQMITIKSVDGDQITVDANQPLAGQTLYFDAEIIGVREAIEEKFQHGDVHNGHQH